MTTPRVPYPAVVIMRPGQTAVRYLVRPVDAGAWQRRATEATVVALVELAQIAAELAVVIPVLAGELARMVDDEHDGYPAGGSAGGSAPSGVSDPVYPVVVDRMKNTDVRELAEILAGARRVTRHALDVHAQTAALRRSIDKAQHRKATP